MRSHSLSARFLTALMLTIPLGCSSRPPLKKTPPPAPLLMSKTPIQAKFGNGRDAHARPDPVPPTMPAGAWAQGPSAPSIHVMGPDSVAPVEQFRVTSEKHDTPAAGQVSLAGVVEKTA